MSDTMLVQIKKEDSVDLEEVTIERTYSDSTLYEVKIINKEGDSITLRLESYSIYLYRPAPPVLKKVWTLVGNLKGVVPFEKEFTDQDEALEAQRSLRDEDVETKLKEKEVEV